MRGFRTPLSLIALALAPLCGCDGPVDQPSSSPASVAGLSGFPLKRPGTDGGVSILEAPATRVLPGNASAFDLIVATSMRLRTLSSNRDTVS